MKLHKLFVAVVLAVAGFVSVSSYAQTSTTYTVETVQPFTCVDQTAFFCAVYQRGVLSGVPVTVNGTPSSIIIDLFGNFTYGYVSILGPAPEYFSNLSIVKGPLDQTGHFMTLQIADKSGDLLLNLDVTWTKESSGGGRGSHNVIYLPVISTSQTQPSYYVSAN